MQQPRPRLLVNEEISEIPNRSAIPDRWASGETLAESAVPSPYPGLRQRIRIVRSDFKYPLIRIEESFRRDDQAGVDILIGQSAMVADHLIVKLSPGTQESDFAAAITSVGASIRSLKPASKVYLITVPDPLAINGLPDAIDTLKALSGVVRIAEPDFIVHASLLPDDASFSQLYGLHNTGQTGGTPDADIDAPEAWEITTGSRTVRVGVIDTGIDYTHPDLAANIWTNPGEIPGNNIDDDGNGYIDDVRGWDFVNNDADPMDDHYHGTHCAGTIGGVGNNGSGVTGVNWEVSLVGLKFLSASGSGTTSDAVEAVSYANILGLDLTSNSWGGGGYSQALYDAISEAGVAGHLFIAAAGNSSRNTDAAPHFPSCFDLPNIISVAATDSRDQLASFSNYGTNSVDLAAPGVSILSTSPGAGYRSLSGTSMATPHVAGAAALLLARHPELSAATNRDVLLASSDATASLVGKTAFGRLNVHAALLGLEDVLVTSSGVWTAKGPVGGPFPATTILYKLANLSDSPRAWMALVDVPWAQLDTSAGVIPAGSSTTITLSLVSTSAQDLPAGTHSGLLRIINSTSGVEYSRPLSLTATPPSILYFDLSTDPGWARTGQWEFGHPGGLGGQSFGNPDPVAGNTDNNVFGVNLQGNYNGVGGPFTLTTSALNLTGFSATRLQFHRWLNSDYEPFASATVDISTNGTTWNTLWRNGASLITDSAWSLQDIDLSAYADNQAAVYLRWTYTLRSGVWPLSGWNIDDITILGAPLKKLGFAPHAPLSESSGSASVTLLLDPAPDAPLAVSFVSSHPGTVGTPVPVEVSPGVASVVIPLVIYNNNALDGSRTVTLTAQAQGRTATPLSLTIDDDEVATLSLELPASAIEGTSGVARISSSAPTDGPVSVTLLSSLPDAVSPPASVTIPAGATSVDFPLTFPDNIRIENARTAIISASVTGWVTGQGELLVEDNDLRVLSLSFIAGLAEGQGPVADAATLTLSGTLTTPLIVALSSSDTGELSVPATITVPAGTSTVTFPVSLSDDAELDGIQTVDVTATASSFIPGQVSVTIADNDPASFVFDAISSPQYVNQSFRARIVARDVNGEPALGFKGVADLTGRIESAIAAVTPLQTGVFTNGVWEGALAANAPGSSWTVTATNGPASGTSNTFKVDSPAVQILTLENNDLVYDPGTHRLYASTPAGTIVPVNPDNAAPDPAITVATTPATLLARATDGSRLWIAHASGKQIRQLALPSLTPGGSFVINGGATAVDLVAVPDVPAALATLESSTSPQNITIYDDGVARPFSVSGYYLSSGIEAGSASRIYSYYDSAIKRLTVTPQGVVALEPNDVKFAGYGSFQADGTLLAMGSGTVLDGDTAHTLATLPYTGLVQPDAAAKRVYLLSDQGGGIRRLRAYDTDRYGEAGFLDVNGVSGSPGKLIRWGDAGLAFRTPTQIFILNSALVPLAGTANLQVTQLATPNPAVAGKPLNFLVSVRNLGGSAAESVVLTNTLPTGASLTEAVASHGTVDISVAGKVMVDFGTLAPEAEVTLRLQVTPSTNGTAVNVASVTSSTGDPYAANNSASASVSVSAASTIGLRRMSIGARAVAYDSNTDRLLVTTGNAASAFPNSLLRIDPDSAATLSADFIGNNPGALVLTNDGQYAYAILNGSYGIGRLPVVPGAAPLLNFQTDQTSHYTFQTAGYIATIPGRPGAVAARLKSVSSSAGYGVGLFDEGVLLPKILVDSYTSEALAASADGTRLYGLDSGVLTRLDILPDGLSLRDEVSVSISSTNSLKRAGNRLYTGRGTVFDPETLVTHANLNIIAPMEPSLDEGVLYIANGSTLRTYDLTTFASLGTLSLGSIDGSITSMVRSGGQSLAFVTSTGQLYLIDNPATIPLPSLTVVLPERLTEGVGSVPGVGRLEIYKPAATDITVSLTSSDPTVLDVTRIVAIPAGETFVTFDISVTDNAGLNGTRPITVTATTPASYKPKSATTLVDDDETAVLYLTLPPSLTEGASSNQAIVGLSAPALAPVIVSLASSDTTELTVPPTVTIPAGTSSVNFTLTAVDDDLMDGPQSATIVATVPGYTSASVSAQVADNEARVITLTLPASFKENPISTSVQVSLSGKTLVPVTVSLISDDTSEFAIADSVTIGVGASSAYASASVVDDALLDGDQTVTITATAQGFTSAVNTVVVRDNDPATGEWSIIGSPQLAGGNITATLTFKTIEDKVADGYNATAVITATNDAGPATLRNSPVNLNVYNGVANTSYDISVLTAGSGTRLSAKVTALPAIQSNEFTVQNNTFSRFAISSLATTQIIGTPETVSITAQDNYGNTVSNYTNSATLSAAPAPTVTGTAANSEVAFPINAGSYKLSRTQAAYAPAEIGGAGRLTALSLELATPPSVVLQNWTIRMKHAVAANPASWDSAGWTVVHQSNANLTTSSPGWVEFPLTTPYDYDGTSYLLVDFTYNNTTTGTGLYGAVRTTYASASRTRYLTTSSTVVDPLLWSGSTPSASTTSATPNLRLARAASVTVSPEVTSAFVAGNWTGPISFLTPSTTPVTLQARQGMIFGQSNPLTVFPSPLVSISPSDTFTISGPIGSDFTGHARSYTLTNTSASPITWSIAPDVVWLTATPATGALAPSASTTFVLSPSAVASSLASKTHVADVLIDVDGTTNTSIRAELTVTPGGVLALTPETGFVSDGRAGGPFTPANTTWTLSNPGDVALTWTASKTAPWLSLSSSSGTLAPGASTSVVVSLQPAADTLPAGDYTDVITFTNTGTGSGDTTRNVTLSITPPLPPVIETHPVSVFVTPPENAAFRVVMASESTFEYQWYRGESGDIASPVANATGSVLVTPVSTTGSFWVRISNAAGTVDSATAVATVTAPPSMNLLATGSNTLGELGDGTTISKDRYTPAATGVTQLASGQYHIAFVKTDGSLWTAGQNTYGQLGDGTATTRAEPVQVATGVAQVDAGKYYTMFVKTDSTLWAMGLNTDGQHGAGANSKSTPVQVATGVRQVSCGSAHTVFIKTDGTLWAMGANTKGQLGDGSLVRRLAPVPIASDVVQASAGEAYMMFIKSDGSLWACGDNGFGQLGDGTLLNRSTPVMVAQQVASVSAGHGHTVFIKVDRTLWGFGSNANGRLGDGIGTIITRVSPFQIASDVAHAYAASVHTLFVKADDTLWASGANDQGQLGDGTKILRLAPVLVATGVDQASASWSFSHAISKKPVVLAGPVSTAILPGQTAGLSVAANGAATLGYQWHMGDSGDVSQPVHGATLPTFTTPALSATTKYWVRVTNDSGFADSAAATVTVCVPPSITTAPSSVSITPYSNAVFSIEGTGGALSYQWYRGAPGDLTQPMVGATKALFVSPALFANATYWVRVTNLAGTVDSPAATASLTAQPQLNLYAIGSNTNGQLGIGSLVNHTLPQQVTDQVSRVSGGSTHSAFVKANGSLWTTGANPYGQLGDGTNIQRTSPVQIATDVALVETGNNSTFFIKTDGTLWGAGLNDSGQFGDGTSYVTYRAPVQITDGVCQVSASTNSTTMFVKTDGTLWLMGRASYNQFETGANYVPLQVATGVAQVATGANHTIFLKHDGTLWGTGYNFAGNLGDGTSTNRSTPVLIATGVVHIATGDNLTLFLKADGSLWATGSNDNAQLGDGTTNPRFTPFLMATQVRKMAAGASHLAFVKYDGTFWVCGGNGAGQLGDGTSQSRPAIFQTNVGILDLSLGAASTHLLQSPPPTIGTQPISSSVVEGETATLVVSAASPLTLTYQWYHGVSGDTDEPVPSGFTPFFTTPPVVTPLSYWVRVTNAVGSVDSQAATFTPILPPDTDSDGLPDAWETAHGLNASSDSADHGRLGDPDRDGIPNLLEYAMGLDPRSAEAQAPVSSMVEAHPESGQNHLVYSYRRLIYPGALTYNVTTSTNLVTWSAPAVAPETLSTVPNPDGLTETVTLRINPALGTGRLFIRLQVDAP